MGDLPLLVRFGWWISKVLVLACAVLGVALVWWRRRARERSQVSLERIARTAAVTAIAPGSATVMGKVRGRAVTAMSDAGGVVSDRSDELVLDVQGQRIALEGRVDVVRGTRGAASWRSVPPLVPEAATKGAGAGPWRAAAIGDGDEVIVRGVLSHESGEAGDYRESGGAWVMKHDADASAIDAWATSPAIVAPALHPVRIATYALLCGFAGYLALWGIGSSLVSGGKDALPDDHLSRSLIIASALPHVRHEALDRLTMQADDDLPRTETNIRTYIGLVGLLEGCADQADRMVREEMFDEALATARGCGDVDEQIEALVHLGRYDEAAALLPKAGSSPAVLAIASIGAGKWAETARAAHIMVQRFVASPASDQKINDDLLGRYECLEAYFSSKAGDAGASKRLADIRSDEETCAVARVLVLPEPERQQALATLAHDPEHGSLLARELGWIDAPETDGYMLMFLSYEMLLGEPSTSPYVWLSQLAIAHRAADAPDLAFVTAQHAIFTLVRGDTKGALAELASAKQKLSGDQVRDLDELEATLLLHTGTTAIPYTPRDTELPPGGMVAIRNGQVPADVHLLSLNHEDELRRALVAAVGGDGGPLAQHLLCCRPMFEADAGAVLGAVPRVTQHRAELAAALRWFHMDYGYGIEQMPFSQLAVASLRRDIARLAGDEDAATKLQKLVDAQLPVVADRDKLIAYLLWHS